MESFIWVFPFNIPYHCLENPHKPIQEFLTRKKKAFINEIRGILIEFEENSIKLVSGLPKVKREKKSCQIFRLRHTESTLPVRVKVQIKAFIPSIGDILKVKVANVDKIWYYLESTIQFVVIIRLHKVDGFKSSLEKNLQQNQMIRVKIKQIEYQYGKITINTDYVGAYDGTNPAISKKRESIAPNSTPNEPAKKKSKTDQNMSLDSYEDIFSPEILSSAEEEVDDDI